MSALFSFAAIGVVSMHQGRQYYEAQPLRDKELFLNALSDRSTILSIFIVGTLVCIGLFTGIIFFYPQLRANNSASISNIPTPIDQIALEATLTAKIVATQQAASVRTASASPTATALPEPTSSCVAIAMQIVDVAWDYDWLKVIDALTLARTCDDTNQAVLDKLYVAYYNYGQLLLTQGNKVEAAKQFRSALSVKSTGSEAQLALAQLTPTPSPSPTRRPVPPTATPTRAAYALVTMLNGSGNADTQHITIPQGSVRVVVNYSDAPRTGTVSQAEVDYHNQVLRIWDNWYQTALAPLTFALEDAVRANDAVAVVRVTRQMNELKAQYSREVNSENQRYADAVARARSQTTPTDIKVWSNQVSTNSSDLLGGWTGSGTQDMFFFSTGGNDYYFRVQATGSWSLTVYQKP